MPRRNRNEDPVPTNGERLSDIAHQRILDALFERAIAAGAFLSQRDLSAMLDIPIQPLRDALKALESDGLVTIHPRSGIQFIKPDIVFHHNTYQFRTLIERAAAKRYAEVGNAAEIDDLLRDHRALIERIETHSVDEHVIDEMEVLERRLHDGMIASLNNPLIEAAARRLKNYVLLMRLDRVLTKPFILRTLSEHVDILVACAERDPDAAERAVTAHFQAVMGRLLGTL